mgnify:CR=1 FL=1
MKNAFRNQLQVHYMNGQLPLQVLKQGNQYGEYCRCVRPFAQVLQDY